MLIQQLQAHPSTPSSELLGLQDRRIVAYELAAGPNGNWRVRIILNPSVLPGRLEGVGRCHRLSIRITLAYKTPISIPVKNLTFPFNVVAAKIFASGVASDWSNECIVVHASGWKIRVVNTRRHPSLLWIDLLISGTSLGSRALETFGTAPHCLEAWLTLLIQVQTPVALQPRLKPCGALGR
jgi:hypothetical protein